MSEDEAFLEAFERCAIAPDAFRHRDHLRMTWLYLRRDGAERARVRIVEGLRRFARHHGAERVFDRALTDAWIDRVVRAVARRPELSEFSRFLDGCPELLARAPASSAGNRAPSP